jgi:hypothetical protein
MQNMYKRTNTHKLISYQINEVITTTHNHHNRNQLYQIISYHINSTTNGFWKIHWKKKKKLTYLLTPINPILQMENKCRKTTQLHVTRDERRGRHRERDRERKLVSFFCCRFLHEFVEHFASCFFCVFCSLPWSLQLCPVRLHALMGPSSRR